MKDVCSIVSTRAARLTAAGLAAVATRLGKEKDMVVAVDGSVFEKYPRFQDKMKQVPTSCHAPHTYFMSLPSYLLHVTPTPSSPPPSY